MQFSMEQVLQQAISAHKQGNIQEALRLYLAILQGHPKHPDVNHNLGLIAVSLNQVGDAIPLFKAALDANPDVEQFWMSYVDGLVKADRLKEAHRAIKKAKKRGLNAKKLMALLTQGNPLANASDSLQARHENLQKSVFDGRFDDAEKLAKSVIQEFAEDQIAWKVLGLIYNETGRESEAVKAFKTSVALDANDAEAHNNLGSVLYATGAISEAVASFNQALALKPDYAAAHNNLGNSLKELGRLDQAESSYRQATLLKPDFSDAHYNLGVLLFESKKYALAAEQFELCDSPESKRYAIKCCYEVAQEAVFYEKYEGLITRGVTDAVMGSLGFRSEFKYGKKLQNSFCSDPLKYAVEIDLNEVCDFKDIFIETARDFLADDSVSYRAQGHLTNGVQTAGNIFAHRKIIGTKIRDIINAEIEKYRVRFKESEEGLIKKWPSSFEITGWLVCMQKGGKLAPHIHDSGWITGSVYINVPKKSGTDNGNLVLCLSDQDHVLGSKENHRRVVDVETGTLCLFPSSLHHHTIPFDEAEQRIVLAFDIVPKNQLS